MNTQIRTPVPLRPDRAAASGLERQSWHRAVAAKCIAARERSNASDVLRRTWQHDSRAAYLLRAAQNPTDSTTFPAYDAVAAFRSLAPGSAATRVFNAGHILDLSGAHTFRLPYIAGTPPVPIFVGEGAPHPALQWTTKGTTLGPAKKILVGTGVTRELNDATPETAVTVIGQMLRDASNKSLDTIAFDSALADTVRPAGLLNGATLITAGANWTEDLSNLDDAIAAAGIDVTGIVYVMPAKQAKYLKGIVGPKFDSPILPSLGVPPKRVIAIAPAGVYSGYDGAPSIETSMEAVYHEEDTTPLPIASPGSPPVVAAPVRSTFQTDVVALRVRARCAWTVMPGAAAYIDGVTW